jgi:hypothetical protein
MPIRGAKARVKNRMNRLRIAVLLVAALLLVGGAGAVKPEKEPVDRVVLVHYKDGVAAKPAPGLTAASYKLLGVKWRSVPVPYWIDVRNGDRLPDDAVTKSVGASFATWDAETSKDLFRNEGLWSGPDPDPAIPDRKNVVYWGSMGSSNANIIAMTTYWYTRGTREFIDADIEMNDDMTWGTGAPGEYDVQNIATHEAGHVCGLGDLYGPRDTALTMYGYSSTGETSKRDLAAGDITGLRKLYGA